MKWSTLLALGAGLVIGLLLAAVWSYGTQSSSVNSAKKAGAVMLDAPGVEEKVIFENARVRIVRFHFEPHAIVPMHPAPDVVTTWLTDGHFRLTHPDGSVQDLHVQAGQTEWFNAQMHTGQNLADTPLDFVVTQMK